MFLDGWISKARAHANVLLVARSCFRRPVEFEGLDISLSARIVTSNFLAQPLNVYINRILATVES